MKVSYLLLISLLIVGALFVPAVSAETIIIDDDGYGFANGTSQSDGKSYGAEYYVNQLKFNNIEYLKDIQAVFFRGFNSGWESPTTPQSFTVDFKISGVTVGSGRYGTFIQQNGKMCLWITFENWDPGTRTGVQTVSIVKTDTQGTFPVMSPAAKSHAWASPTHSVYPMSSKNNKDAFYQSAEVYYRDVFKNTYTIQENNNFYTLNLQRVFDGKVYGSALYLKSGDTVIHPGTQFQTINYEIDALVNTPITVGIKNGVGKWYNQTFYNDLVPPTPTIPSHVVTDRTGTVTMTDHNGTTITGFEVTAVNVYTGQSYNVSTDTDVAVMTLPMDRTIRLRNPQTGEYEDAPVGYYKFYGHKTGYKMLNEDGIQISVLPEEYTSYQLCIILVTPESGPLSGKHKFQIRSRTDNSILQTGTISAKSATTNQWYNTTVSDGIATLILPYDTSNPISQYAGNYYVYATSPGYQDSDYGTQIVVMPHTVSEINTILLTPIGGIPAAGNVTLRIQAFSETGPGIPNAEIFIAGVLGAGSDVWNTYTASSTGYLTVSVPGNSTYNIVASGAGYYDSARRIEVFTDDPPLIEIKLYLSGAPTVEPTTQPTGWVTTQPTTQPTGGIPDEDDDSEGFLMEAVRGIGLAFGVGFATAKLIFGMLLALAIGYSTAKQLRGGAAEFGLGLLGGTLLGVLIGLLPVWTVVVLLLIVGLYIGNRYVGGANNG